MTQWQSLSELDVALQGRVMQLYQGKFPIDTRRHLSVWIESQDWAAAAWDGAAARTCFQGLLVYLEEQWSRSLQDSGILQGPDFSRMRDDLMEHFQNEPQNLAALFSHLLTEERRILASASKLQVPSDPHIDSNCQMLDNQINKLKTDTLEVRKEISALEDLNEKLDFLQKVQMEQPGQPGQPGQPAQNHSKTDECLRQANFIAQTKQILLKQVAAILEQAEQVVLSVTGEQLPRWRRRQQLACIGGPADGGPGRLQDWFTRVAEVLLGVRQQLQRLQEQSQKYGDADASGVPQTAADIDGFAAALLSHLLSRALVVEEQPVIQKQPQYPLILKTHVRFKVTLRFLVNLPEFKRLLKVQPVFDKDVAEVKTVPGFRLFELVNNSSKVLDVETEGGALVAHFGNMSIREKPSRVKGSAENQLVTEELHLIKFVTTVQLPGLTLDLEASSLPVVVVSSSSQIPSAWASIMWWYTFSSEEPWNLSLFADPPPLSWQQLAQVLSWQFVSVGQRELDDHQLDALRARIVDDPDGLVHWNAFSKKENAWVWIHGILDLIKKHLVDLWRDGSIMGFVSKEKTRSLLLKKPPGTFLLRFSESSKDGAITFSWVEESAGEKRVHAVQPYNKKELQALSLPDIIYHYGLKDQKTTSNPLLYLYPDIHKDAAFGCYYTVTETAADQKVSGYVHRRLVCVSEEPSPPCEELNTTDADQAMETSLCEELPCSDSQFFHLDPLPLGPPSPLLACVDLGRFL